MDDSSIYDLLDDLDSYASQSGRYMGLPIADEEPRAEMMQIVREWLAKTDAAES